MHGVFVERVACQGQVGQFPMGVGFARIKTTSMTIHMLCHNGHTASKAETATQYALAGMLHASRRINCN